MKSIITQTLVSIQGEGFGIGRPILLIRFGGCNYQCSFCDSAWTNLPMDCDRFSPLNNKSTPFIVDENNIRKYIDYIQVKFLSKYNIRTVLFTGGETFLNVDFMREFINISNIMEYFDTYEIETNGSLLYENDRFIMEYSDKLQLNISPKQTECFDKYDVGFKYVLKNLKGLYKNSNSFLKFVYRRDLEEDILAFIKKFKPQIPIYMSSMTPQHGSENFLEEYRKSCLSTLEFCLKTGYKYSPREHVFLFGENREEFESTKENK